MVGEDDEHGREAWGHVPPPPAGEPLPSAYNYPGGHGWQEPQGTDSQGVDQGVDPNSTPFAPKRRFRVGTVLRYAILLVAGGAVLIGWLSGADRDTDGAITKPGDLAANELRVGDCFDDPGSADEVSQIRAVPCDQPHDLEVYHEFDHADADEPPPQEVASRRIEAECLPAFEAFVGFPYQESELDFFLFEPTAEGWRQGDRTVQCAVYNMDGSQLTGTARGAGR